MLVQPQYERMEVISEETGQVRWRLSWQTVDVKAVADDVNDWKKNVYGFWSWNLRDLVIITTIT